MQGEWDIEMADDDEVLPPADYEQYTRYGEGTAIQDILSGRTNILIMLQEASHGFIALFAMQTQPGGNSPNDNLDSRISGIRSQDLTRLLSVRDGSASPTYHHLTGGYYGAEDEEEDQDGYYDSFRQTAPQWFQEVTEPQKPGVELLKSGDFGRIADKLRSRRSDVNIAKLMSRRSSRPTPVPYKENYASVSIIDSIDIKS
jgi:WD repeat-containing protein 23